MAQALVTAIRFETPPIHSRAVVSAIRFDVPPAPTGSVGGAAAIVSAIRFEVPGAGGAQLLALPLVTSAATVYPVALAYAGLQIDVPTVGSRGFGDGPFGIGPFGDAGSIVYAPVLALSDADAPPAEPVPVNRVTLTATDGNRRGTFRAGGSKRVTLTAGDGKRGST